MRKSKKKFRALPAVSTTSLPDIVFILLFFFMTVTVIKDTNLLVENTLPNATEAVELKSSDGIIELRIGKPLQKYQGEVGMEPQIQLEGKFIRVDELQGYVLGMLNKMAEHNRRKATVSLKVDKTVGMGIVADIKAKLRAISLLKINYATLDGEVLANL